MITFTRHTLTYDAATDTSTSATTTITGSALQVRGSPDTYQRLSLIESGNPTLLFTPTNYELHAGSDEFVKVGDTVVWATQTYAVRDVSPVAPDGVVVLARIIVGR